MRNLICHLRGHRVRLGRFDRRVLAHDVWCERCGVGETAERLMEALGAVDYPTVTNVAPRATQRPQTTQGEPS